MNKKLLATSVLALLVSMGANAQRFTDKLDRGLVAVKTTKGVYCSWRIQADEYYDVKYNLYRDGTRGMQNLSMFLILPMLRVLRIVNIP